MEKLTVRQLLSAHHRINNGLIEPEFYVLMPKKLQDFNRSWGKKVKEHNKKLNDLWDEHFIFENGNVKTEDVFEEKEVIIYHSWYQLGMIFKKPEKKTEKIKIGTRRLTTGKYTDEEFAKLENDILNEVVTSW